MSNNNKKNIKKVKKGLSPEAKRNLGLTFKSLISNQACIDGAKEAPWWIGVIFLVLSMSLPVIPIIVNCQKAYGSSFVATYNYSADRGMANTAKQYVEDGYEFRVVDQKLSFYKNDKVAELPAHTLDGATYNYEVKHDVINGVYNFDFVITTEVDVDKNNKPLTNLVNAYVNQKYVNGTTTPWNDSYAETNHAYVPSYAVFAPNTMVVVLMKNDTATVATSSLSGCSWTYTANGELLSRIFEGVELDNIGVDKTATDKVWSHYKALFDETYHAQRDRMTLNSSLIYLGVYTGLIFFLGLMVFLLTRGKSNPFRYLKIFTCLKIGWWASFTPAVLGLIFGFIFTTNVIGQMSFIVLASIRIMWLSMRQLRPM